MTLPAATVLANVDENLAPLDLHRIGPEVLGNRRAEALAGLVVEAAVVLWALNHVAHHQPVGEAGCLVRAEPRRGEKGIIGAAVDSKRAAGMIEADHVLG